MWSNGMDGNLVPLNTTLASYYNQGLILVVSGIICVHNFSEMI